MFFLSQKSPAARTTKAAYTNSGVAMDRIPGIIPTLLSPMNECGNLIRAWEHRCEVSAHYRDLCFFAIGDLPGDVRTAFGVFIPHLDQPLPWKSRKPRANNPT